tara:strand:+ start:107 stop:1504 length:1398 start_codon:yes stop_codon:yes gene_type:complete
MIVLFIAFLAFTASLCSADILTLKDGTVYEGVITKENRAEVVIEITIANIKTTKTFPRYKVKSIEHKAVETPAEEKPSESKKDLDTDSENDSNKTSRESIREQSTKMRVSAADRTPFMVIPVIGMIGVETNANGLRKALHQAKRRKINHIVFTIDSGGGFVYDAVETLKVLKEFDEELTYHALVEEGAISAASVYVAAADDIFVRPDARVGGAVAYSEDNTSGATEVDAKFNSIWAAEIAARAESKGFPPEIFRAMVVLDAEVWFDDENKVFASRPSGANAQQIDSKGTILTIRAGQMVQIGMATEFTGEPNELGELLGLQNWSEVPGMGKRIMDASSKERIKLTEKFKFAIDTFADAREDFELNAPQSFSDYRYHIERNGLRVPEGTSVQLWRKRSSASIIACDIMLQALTQIADVNRRAKKAGALHLDIVPDSIGDDAYTTIQDARNWLQSNKNSIPQSALGG